MKLGRRDILRLSLGLPCVLGAAPALAADEFSGKTITYIVATKAGGGYDTMGRLVARYLEKHLKGSSVRVKNVPGGSHVIGAETIFNADPDGLTIGSFNTGLIYAQLLGELRPPLDLRKFSWIGKAAVEARILVVGAETGLATVDDLRKAPQPLRFAASGIRGAAYHETSMMAKALAFPVKIIPGFEGREGELSVMRGEIDGMFGSASALAPFVKNGFGRAVVRVGGGDDLNIPKAIDFAVDDDARFLISLIEVQARLSRLTAAPPGMDPARLAALRLAYMQALSDPQFLAEAVKLDLPIVAMPGEDVAVAVDSALNLPADRIEQLKKLIPAQ